MDGTVRRGLMIRWSQVRALVEPLEKVHGGTSDFAQPESEDAPLYGTAAIQTSALGKGACQGGPKRTSEGFAISTE